jgi:hypothetical protein
MASLVRGAERAENFAQRLGDRAGGDVGACRFEKGVPAVCYRRQPPAFSRSEGKPRASRHEVAMKAPKPPSSWPREFP